MVLDPSFGTSLDGEEVMKYLNFFLFALFLSYSSQWGPYYVALFAGNNLKILGSISDHSEFCPDTSRGNINCKVQYRIPKYIFDDVSKASSELGLGIILHATEIGCAKSFDSKINYGIVENAGSTLDFLNIYQTAQLKQLQCDGDILVKAWAPNSYRRYGHVDGPLVLGDRQSVERVKTFTEFFRSEILLILTALFFSVFIFDKVLSSLMRVQTDVDPLQQFSYAWLGFTFLFSGMATTLLPVISGSFFFTRLSNYFSILAHVGPLMAILVHSRVLPNPIIRIANILMVPRPTFGNVRLLHLVLIIYSLSPFFAKGLAPVILAVGIITLIASILHRNLFLFFWGAAMTSDCLKLFMVPYLPTSYLTMSYSLFCLTDAFVLKVKKSAGLVSALRWAREQIESYNGYRPVVNMLQDFADQFAIRQITLIIPKPDGNCELIAQSQVAGKWNTEKYYRSSLPPMFSHVITTRENLWHVDEDSLFALNLRKGEVKLHTYSSKYFSIVPLIKDSVPVGAIALTNYSDIYALDEFYKLKLNSVANLLFPFLSTIIAHQNVSEKEDWTARCTKIADLIFELKYLGTDHPIDFHLDKITDLISQELSVASLIGQLDVVTRQIDIKSVAGHSEEVVKEYKASKFYAVLHNEQGPLALAINRQRTVTIGDISWIRGVLHPMTVRMFEKLNVHSFAAIPLMDLSNSEKANQTISTNETWGVLWLESKTLGFFQPQTEAGLNIIARAIENFLNHLEISLAHTRTKKALAGFVPQKILGKLMQGSPVREEEAGYLLMADLRDSTKLSRIVGADKWSLFTKQLAAPAEVIAQEFGFTLQSIVWDAFYFTKAKSSEISEIKNINEFVIKLNSLFDFACRRTFGEAINLDDLARARFCLTYGDVTRDIRSSLNNNWTIVGTAMASVSKLEQECKMIKGWFFIASSVVQGYLQSDWIELNRIVPGTNEKIFSFDRSVHLVAIDEALRSMFINNTSSENKEAA